MATEQLTPTVADLHVSGSARLRPAYGFDDVALVPGALTIDPDDVDISWQVGPHRFELPVVASAMDGVVDPAFAVALGRLGGLAVLNLDGLQTRYDDPAEPLARIAAAPAEQATALLQDLYREPVRNGLIRRRVEEIKAGGVIAAVSTTPANAAAYGRIAVDAGVDVFVVQATVTAAQHRSRAQTHLSLRDFCRWMPVPVIVGNCVAYSAALELMDTGIAALLVGVGPGAACTSREVLGVGVPQVTATLDCAMARRDYRAQTGHYVPLITDGGMRTGGDLAKAIASGADAVMLGSPFAQTTEAPGKGHHWGMATPHPGLPRGTRIKVGVQGSLDQLLFGPTSRTDGTQNLMGALRTSMGVLGAANLGEMHAVDMVIAPSIKTEGKLWQLARAF
ncbi:MAG TPA: GuaB3 family IMP dehydrogenase-related protein [Chloroflexota bacterium]|jgi:IMP dehydrogenase